MRRLIIKSGLILILSFIFLYNFISIQAQRLHDVTVKNTTFSPADLNINIGDTVRWTNIEGSHNVNGTQITFPSNPESFGNSVSEGWIFTHVFNISGKYNYQCDPHAAFGMMGSIIVGEVTNIRNMSIGNDFIVFYPNPASEFFAIKIPEQLFEDYQLDLIVYNSIGNMILFYQNINSKQTYDISHLQAGIYFYQIKNLNSIIETGKIIVKESF
ncbi:MAG: T9SS type A sorting domain-containing protein [Bacteroidales bacterium]|nr:T9SS type A sorting domain-containing protein [Bacteroidales bacterium]